MLPVVIGGVLGFLAIVAVVNLVMAAVMPFTVRLAAGFRPGYWRCYLTSLAAHVLTLLAVILIGASGLLTGAGPFFRATVGLAIQVAIYTGFLTGPTGQRLTAPRALPVAAIQTALFAAFTATLSADTVSTQAG